MKSLILIIFAFSTSVMAQTKATQKLFSAIEKNNFHMAKNAIKDGADPNGANDLNAPTTSAFLKAVHLKRLKIVKLLLENHADVNQHRPIDRFTGLMIAAKFDLHEIAELLAAYQADPNSTTVMNRTALHIAALHNSLTTAEEILKMPNVDVNTRVELCPLAVAARQGYVGMVLLLKKQTGSKASNPICVEKALELAELNKHEDVVMILKN